MNSEFAPAIVYNPRSGDGKSPSIIAAELKHSLGDPAEVLSFFDVLEMPEKIAGKNVIIIGGDGTQGTIAVLHQRQSPGGWLLPADGGTAGIVSESLGWGRKIRESSEQYGKRLSRDLQDQTYRQIHVPLGIHRSLQYDENQLPTVRQDIFFWNLGIGMPLTAGLRAMENKRGSTSKAQRVGVLFESYYHELKRAEPQTIIVAGDRRTVFEAHIHKDPFKNLQLFSLPYSGHDLLMTIPYEKRPEVVRRILIDIALMTFRLPPLAHGIEIVPLRLHEVVIFERTHDRHTTARIDSELGELELPSMVQADVPNERGFSLLQRRSDYIQERI